jgi:hypothetical protein
MEAVLLKKSVFNLAAEEKIFTDLFGEIASRLGESAFVKFRGKTPIGGLAPAYFEAVALGCLDEFGEFKTKPPEKVKDALIGLVQSVAFRDVTGPGANTSWKLESRIQLVANAVKTA